MASEKDKAIKSSAVTDEPAAEHGYPKGDADAVKRTDADAQAKTPSETPADPSEKDPRKRNKPKAHDPEHAGLTTSASARTRGAAQRTVPQADAVEARPNTGRESVDPDVPSPVTPKVQRNVTVFGDPVRVPDSGDVQTVKDAKVIIQDASAVILTIVGTGQGQPSTHYRFDAQTLLAVRRELDGAAIAIQ